MQIQANKKKYRDILNRNLELIVPYFQRPYKWTKKECEKLIKDLKNAYALDIKEYFLGDVWLAHNVDENERGFGEYMIVDSQQRTTTLTLLYLAIYNRLVELEAQGKEMPVKSTVVKEQFLFNKSEDGTLHRKLKLQRHNDNELENLYKSTPTNGLIAQNYRYFKNVVSKSNDDLIKLHEMLKRCVVAYFEIPANYDPQVIFNIINSSGRELTIEEKITNLLLMGLSYEEQKFYYEEKMQPMISNLYANLEMYHNALPFQQLVLIYTRLKRKEYVINPELYDDFRWLLFDKNVSNKQIIEELYEIHDLFITFKKNVHHEFEIQNFLDMKEIFGANVVDTIVFFLLLEYRMNKIEKEELLATLDMIKNFIVTRFICGKNGGSVNYHFSAILKNFSEEKTYFETVKDYFKDKKESVFYFPPNNEVKDSIRRRMYKTEADSNKLKYILIEIEKYFLKQSDIRFRIDSTENLTIEHIMPQKLPEAWKRELGRNYELIHFKRLDTLANLTLTADNSQLSNHSFDKKKETYQRSTLKMNRMLCKYDKWDEDALENRIELLFEAIKEVFPYFE